MDITITPTKLQGSICAIPSKSQAHRLLICAAFADKATTLYCPATNQDIEATAACLRSLGAEIQYQDSTYTVSPVRTVPATAILDCNESGSTLRFMLPIVGALGVSATFLIRGRLSQRPLSPLWEEMEKHGCNLSKDTEGNLHCSGRLTAGDYTIRGDVSSQFITGLLFAITLMDGVSTLTIVGKTESAAYIKMTQAALSAFSVKTDHYTVKGPADFVSPGHINVEGDWSNAAFFLAAEALGNNVTISALNPLSQQGDKAISRILTALDKYTTIDAADIPDLVPILSVVAAARKGATFTNIRRLRLKESDRVMSVIAMLNNLGINATADENSLTVFPGKFHAGTVSSASDHRIAMSAAIAATIADGAVKILDAQCVAKSYPSFWEEYRKLGGNYEQHIR